MSKNEEQQGVTNIYGEIRIPESGTATPKTKFEIKDTNSEPVIFRPVIEFRDLNHAVCLLKEWQDRLGLSEWIIEINLCMPCEFIEKDKSMVGECEYEATSKTSVIRILSPEYCVDTVIKSCVEKTLIHELLHLKFILIETDNNVFELITHQLVEDLAKSLICAKYDIGREWFNNIKY